MHDRLRFSRRAARSLLLPLGVVALTLSGCTLARHDATATFDLGVSQPMSAAQTGRSAPSAQSTPSTHSAQSAHSAAPSTLPAISVAEPDVPAWLDRPRMVYRLTYASDQQARVYATSRWTMPPGDLFALRLKSRLADAGGIVVPASDGALDMPQLRMEIDDFSQVFHSPTDSTGRVALRTTLFRDRTLIAQQRFVVEVPAPTPDAEGGAIALRRASDQIIDGVMQWLSTLPPQK